MSRRIEDRLTELKSLPELEPSADLEPAALAAMAKASAIPAQRQFAGQFAKAASWIAVIGIGALLTLTAVNYEQPVEPPGPSATSTDEILFQLVEESARLDGLLAMLPESRRVMRADTASTIVGLEDWITLIDAELFRDRPQSAPPEYRTTLMRDRVEAMNALVNVRYAQSRAFIF